MPELPKIVDPNKKRLATARMGRRSSVVAVDVGVGVDGCETVSGVISDFLLGNSSPHGGCSCKASSSHDFCTIDSCSRVEKLVWPHTCCEFSSAPDVCGRAIFSSRDVSAREHIIPASRPCRVTICQRRLFVLSAHRAASSISGMTLAPFDSYSLRRLSPSSIRFFLFARDRLCLSRMRALLAMSYGVVLVDSGIYIK